MAKEISRTFDTTLGAVIVNVQDSFGNISPHTVYVLNTPDVEAAIAAVLVACDVASAALMAKFTAAGWISGA